MPRRRQRRGALFLEGGWLSERKSIRNGQLLNEQVQVVGPAQPSVFVDKQPLVESIPASLSSSDNDGFDSSSVDSELAEDYAGNLDDGLSIDELAPSQCADAEDPLLSDIELMLLETEVESCYSSDGVVDLNGKAPVVVEPSFLEHSPSSRKKRPKDHWQKGVVGQKKQHRRERIREKRRARALCRGVDLENVNMMFESMVISSCDMLALQPMKNRDLAIVSKLAAIYRLKIGSQGSGKKRFPTVTRTGHTALPEGVDNERLLKLLGVIPVKGAEVRRKRHGLTGCKTSKKARSKDGNKDPPSFIASGRIKADDDSLVVAVSAALSSKGDGPIGMFEAHTKGFGSRMLAKMGFVEGSGLGRNGQGMRQPLLPRMRPKSLGVLRRNLKDHSLPEKATVERRAHVCRTAWNGRGNS